MASKPKTKRGATPLSIPAAIARAIGMQRAGDDLRAAGLYRGVLARSPKHVDALHFLGVAEHRLGRAEVGLTYIERALTLVGDHPDLHNNHGNVLKALGRLHDAQAAYEKAIALRPEDPNALANLGAVAREQGDTERSVQLLEEALALAPQHYEALQHLASALKQLRRFAEAADAQRQALALRPRHADAFLKLGATYYAMGQVDDAAEIYRSWLAIDPAHPIPRHLLAGCTGNEVPERASDDFVRASFDSFAEHFDRSLATLQYRAPQLVADAVATAFGPPARKLTVLDAGCGTGLCGPLLRPYARNLVGVDLSDAMIQRATARGDYDALDCAELGAYLEAANDDYDLIVSADTLVYFGALERVLNAAARALRAGGVIVFTTERAEQGEAPLGYRMHAHGRYSHSSEYLERVLHEAGLGTPLRSQVQLRREAGHWVHGLLVSAKKP